VSGLFWFFTEPWWAADKITVIVLTFGVMQPLITAFSYTDDIAQVKTIVGEVAEVLHGINLHIAPGTVNALVGPSGSEKSTIARLIASLLLYICPLIYGSQP